MCIMHLVPDKIGIKKPSAYITFSDPVRILGMVRQEGLEPPAYWFVASHSIQLSYWRKYQILLILKRYIIPHETALLD